jgi:hypothetical protein
VINIFLLSLVAKKVSKETTRSAANILFTGSRAVNSAGIVPAWESVEIALRDFFYEAREYK